MKRSARGGVKSEPLIGFGNEPMVKMTKLDIAISDHGIMSQSMASSGSETSLKPNQQRNAANARERQRMRVLSKAFNRLKTSLPWVPSDTKLSKLDTLRLASCVSFSFTSFFYIFIHIFIRYQRSTLPI